MSGLKVGKEGLEKLGEKLETGDWRLETGD